MMYPWLDYKGLTYFSKKLRDKLKAAFNDVNEKITDIYEKINGINNDIDDKVNEINSDIDEKVSKSGSTVTGELYLNSGTVIASSQTGESGTSGYIKFLTITVTGTYVNCPILVFMQQRSNHSGWIEIAFSNVSSTTPTVSRFYSYGNLSTVYYVADESVFSFYIQKAEAYDYVQVTDLKMPDYLRNRMTFNWDMDFVTSAPSSNTATANPAYSDGSVTKVGTSTVGGAARGIYLNSGTPTACSSTVGSGTQPIYLSSGTATASSSTVGSGTKPVYLSSGTVTASSSTVGSSYRPVYLNAGTLTQCASALFYTAGDTFNIMYYGAGYVTSSGTTIHFTIAVAREFSGVSSMSVTSKGTATIRENNSYCCGSSADAGVTPSTITVNSFGSGTGLLHIAMTFSSTTNITNNSAVGVALTSTTITCS